ncbi:hypothetical protein QUF64_11665 [Anaerolineales bacterium HSG6]|nr:hypothetical protein [Anaerolineales bacterium HSG6]MDM8530723.1 hypothetical protein [Anaerolineales bacterium HSG25]
MKLSRFLEHTTLHDSVITAIEYQTVQQRCSFKIELCNYLQSTYQPPDAEIVLGQLILTGVQRFDSEPKLPLFSDDEQIDAQILTATSLPADENGVEGWQIAMQCSDYLRDHDQFFLLTIQATDVIWQVEPVIQLNVPYHVFQALENRLTLEPFVVK